jgi:uncharacterized protein YhjY with autotransporter beta-barrel domain
MAGRIVGSAAWPRPFEFVRKFLLRAFRNKEAEWDELAWFGRAAIILILAMFASVGLSPAAHAATCSIPISYTAIGQTTTTDISPCDASQQGAYLVQGTDAASSIPYGANPPQTIVTSNATYDIHFIAAIGGVGADSYSITLVSVTGNTATDTIALFTCNDGSFPQPCPANQPFSFTVTLPATAPTITGLSPTTGPTAGGNTVIISGTGFNATAANNTVTFGSNVATVTGASPTSLTVTAPAGAAGTVDVTVTTSLGTSPTGAADKYTYVTPVIAGAVSATVAYGSSANPITLNLSGGAAASVAVATATSHGTATASGTSITYTPTTGYFGADSFQYTATNAAGTSSPASITITVSPPTITVTPATLTAGTVGIAYNQNLTPSGGQAPYTFSTTLASGALPAGLSLGSNGTITGTPAAAGTFTFTVTGTDSSTTTHASFTSSTISLTINAGLPGAPTIGTATAGNGQATVSFTAPASNGGSPITSYTVMSSPSGITGTGPISPITVTGLTNGTAYTFTVRATNGVGPSPTSAASNSVTPIAPPVAGPGAATVAYGSPANAITLNFSGGAPTSVAVSSAPSHGSTGISGTSITYTPATGYYGADSFQYTGTNGAGTSLPATITITVSAPTITVAPTTLTAGTVGTTYNQSLTPSGGRAPYTFSTTLASGALPAGLSLGSNGTIAGNPTAAGTFTFTVTGTDSSTVTPVGFTSSTISLTINPPTLSITPPSGTTLSGPGGTPYSQAFTASGGGSFTYAFTITSGTLPTGLAFSGSTLSGTATTAGSVSFTVTATSSVTGAGAPFRVTGTYTLTITAPSITVGPTTLPAPAIGVPYNQTVTATGGSGSSTFAITSGSLPAGLSMGPSGVIAGTSTAAGSFNFTVTATDVHNFSGSRPYSFTVGAPSIAVAPNSLPNGAAGTAYSQQLAATGGGAPYAFSVSVGTLPTGLTLDAASGLLHGTPTAFGAFNFTVKATDSTTGTGAPFFGTQAYTVTIAPVPLVTTLAVASTVLTAGSAATPFIPVTASGGTGTLSYAVSPGLPTGLSFSTTTGQITSTPSGASAANTYTVTVTDQTTPTSQTSSKTFSLAVVAPAFAFTPAAGALPNAIAAAAYSQTVAVSGGTAPYTFTIASGALPVGLALNSSTGAITGAATATGSFSFVVSAKDAHNQTGTAAYTLSVTAPAVVAVSTSATAAPGATVTVDLTNGAAGGPFTSAQLLSLSPPSAGTALITLGDTASNSETVVAALVAGGHFLLKFTPSATFSGTAVATFTLSSAFGISAPATVTFTVTPRPDPSKDAEVIGLVNAQAQAAQHFASTQITNFNDRLEKLHDGECHQNSYGLGLTDSRSALNTDPLRNTSAGSSANNAASGGNVGPTDTNTSSSAGNGGAASNGDAGGRAGRRDAKKRETKDTKPSGCDVAAQRFAAWTGGFVNFGRLQTNASTGIDYVSTGISAGVDYWFSPAFTGGFGIGYGHDKSSIGSNGTMSDGVSYSAALYGSWHPSRHTFLDAVIGYGIMNFDSDRYVTGSNAEFAAGSRNGHQIFGSVTSGYEYKANGVLVSPYARVSASWSTLDAFTETGGGIFALQYGTQTVNSFTGGFGIRAEYEIKQVWGAITPRARLEYAHEFDGASIATVAYADLAAGPTYLLPITPTGSDYITTGLGADFSFIDGWMLSIDYRTAFGQEKDPPQMLQMKLGTKF